MTASGYYGNYGIYLKLIIINEYVLHNISLKYIIILFTVQKIIDYLDFDGVFVASDFMFLLKYNGFILIWPKNSFYTFSFF